ncbi:hypothetical protein QR685DRAFT_560382 [Neurospora intermedia]|uniref:Extracellular membrane protein CFEM domain-containing protein n=1 Tax=Neurospora intermedia TaxID=5142 RepID=A0ABR3DKM3_NEUIN
MAFTRPVETPFFPRLPRVSPCFILWGILFSILLITPLVSLFFPSLFFECVTIPTNNTQDDIKPSAEGPGSFFDRITHVQHSHVLLASPTIAASTTTTMTTTSTTVSAPKSPITRLPRSSPRAFHIHRRQYFNVHGQPIQTVHLDDVLPWPLDDHFPMGTDNEIPGVLAACAQPCLKKAVELNTYCGDPLDIECTCRPDVRGIIEAASDECCREACDDGTPEVYWRPCLHEDDPLHY